MEYKCQTIRTDRLAISSTGFVMPLCESCKTRDCTNPIEKTKISVLGLTKKIKTYNRGTDYGFVIQCEGYIR